MTTGHGFNLLDTVLWGSLYTCTSFFFFTALSTSIDSCLVPLHLRISEKKTWKWVNYAVSWCHSTISGSLGVLSLALTPTLFENLIHGYSELAYIACCISYGYFFYDTLDLINNSDKDKGNPELVVHHSFALSSATLVVFTKTYVGYGVVALLIELHSSVLHSRVLYKMYFGPSGSATSSKYYIWIKYLNMVFFFLFRFAALIYLSYGMWRDWHTAPNTVIFAFMSLAIGIILFLSILLFIRVFRSDFMTLVPMTDKSFEAFKEGLVVPQVNSTPPVSANITSNSSISSICSSLNHVPASQLQHSLHLQPKLDSKFPSPQ